MTQPGERLRVLVADDNEDHRFLIVRALRDKQGVAPLVDSVSDGEQALDYVFARGEYTDRERPDLILLDLKMPKVDGFQVLEQIKADEDVKDIPVVILSSSEAPEDITDAYRIGSNSYVIKSSTAAGLRAGLDGISDFWTRLAALPKRDGESGGR
jgi:CheY-like chemotaxis protein